MLVHEPTGAPEPRRMVRTEAAPNMTPGHAALLGLMRRYLAAVMDPSISLLEIHKLMYFMQEAGEPLRLNYSKAIYGPYAENLRHVLSAIEGHFIIGYGDAEDQPERQIELKEDAANQAEEFVENHPDTREHLERVAELIEGFETPFGMELLATVHWVTSREGAATEEEAISKAYAWRDRKRMFQEDHLRVAWEVFSRKEWLLTEGSPRQRSETRPE